MDSKTLRSRGAKTFAAFIPLMFCAGQLKAVNLVTATAATVSCSTTSGPGTAGTITVKPVAALTGTHAAVVTFAAPGSGLVISPSSVTINSTTSITVGVTFSVTVANGCVGAASGPPPVQFKTNLAPPCAVNDATAVVTDTVVATASGLVASPITISCQYTAGGG